MQEKEIRDDARNDALILSLVYAYQVALTMYLTSPAAAANPEMHLAASKDVNDFALAVQQRTAKSRAIDVINEALFPNLTANGTHTRLPNPNNKKLNCELLEIPISQVMCRNSR